jgi:uncharacterized membrane protein SpoIIM required for sporulation
MRQQHFKLRHTTEWQELSAYLASLEDRKLSAPFPASEFPGRYRRLCQHLAIARARGYSRGLQDWLHELVLRAHQRFYGERRAPWRTAHRFLLGEYPRLVRSQWRYLLAAAILFMGPILLMIWLVPQQPELAYTVISPADARGIEDMYDPKLRARLGRERESEDDFAMFAYYIRNNTSIGFQTFVGGLVFGIGSVFYLLFNGIYIGAIAGHLTGLGFIETFWGFVAGHSSYELTAIMLSGAAGLKLGVALVAPGSNTRRKALRDAMAIAIKLMFGAAVLFLIAAFVEAYWSSLAWLPPLSKYVVGGIGWLLVGAYIVLPGRSRAA